MMNETLVERLEDECGLQRYRPPHFYPRYGLTSGKSNQKKPYVIARKWFGVHLVSLERFEGRSSVKAADEIHDILSEYFDVAEPYYEGENRTDIDFRDEY